MKKTREELMQVYDQTINACQVGGYECKNGEWVDLESCKEGSRFYVTLPNTKDRPKKLFYETKVYVQNIDTFQKAREMGPKCAVLNMASFQRPGGGVDTGSRAQEEELCRRSNLLQSLYQYSPDKHGIFDYKAPKRFHYPIPMYGGIYSPNVTVFRHALSYTFLEEPFKCSVISVPAIKKPDFDRKTGLMTEKVVTILKGKIRAILRIALMHSHSKLVLGAWGNGSYGAPPKHTAIIFKEVLAEEEFQHVFEEICFAILEDGNSLKNQEGGNIKPYSSVFELKNERR